VSSSGGGGKAGLGKISLTLWTLARIPVAVLLLVFALALIY
jgi:hypothetical protein